MVQRLTLRRRNRYHTASNVQRLVRTPGGKLTYQQVAKSGSRPSCRDCKGYINGIPGVRTFDLKHLAKSQRTVSRAYGGNCCPSCLRSRIVRSFLLDEQKCVKAVSAEKEAVKVTKEDKKVKEVASKDKKSTKKTTKQ